MERGRTGDQQPGKPAFRLNARVRLRDEVGGVDAGETGTVVGYYATEGQVEYAVSFESAGVLLRLPLEALEPVDGS